MDLSEQPQRSKILSVYHAESFFFVIGDPNVAASPFALFKNSCPYVAEKLLKSYQIFLSTPLISSFLAISRMIYHVY